MSIDLRQEPRWKRKIFARNLEKDNRTFPRDGVVVLDVEEKEGLLRAFRSRDFLIQVHSVSEKECGTSGKMERLSICRAQIDIESGNWSDRISWEELMWCKAKCGYGNLCAVEIFPPDVLITNVANFRHLWVFLEGMPTFMWNRKP